MRSDAARRQHWTRANSRNVDAADSTRDEVAWLIDNSDAYEGLLEAVREARESIWITQLAFDVDCTAYAGDGGGSNASAGGHNLLDAILQVSAERRVSVKILLNATLLLNTKRPLTRLLARREVDSRLVEVRGISRFPQLLHAKMVIVDRRRAFLIGSPFVNGYWDSRSHAPVDHRRPLRELGGRPIHDVSTAVRGPVVGALAETFTRLWDGDRDRPSRLQSPARGKSPGEWGISVVTTEPRGGPDSSDSGSRETLDALLAGIRSARSFIYIEHQYLSSRPVVEALRRALAQNSALEMILVLNQNPDVTAYRRWQNARLGESGLLAHPRVGVFALSSASAAAPESAVNQVFVHSKVVVIDDEWAMVGSANLDGASLHSYGDDFTGRIARRVFRDVRNFDVSLVVRRQPRSSRRANPVRELRRRLWSEHLGDGWDEAMERPGKGFVSRWNAVAARNVAGLNGVPVREQRAGGGSFILPYSAKPTPRAQLADVGVLTSALDLQFDPGWLEVNFSPNWVRNMFL